MQVVRAKAIQSQRNRGKEAKKEQQKSKRGITTPLTPILPQFLLQVPPQTRLSKGFAFLGKHQAPLIQATSSPAKNNPPSCCLIYTLPWTQCFLSGRYTGGEGASLRVFILVNVSCVVQDIMPTGMFIPLL